MSLDSTRSPMFQHRSQLLKRDRQRRQQRTRAQRRNGIHRSSLGYQELEPRLALTGTGFAGNECPPDLDLSGIPAQTIAVGQAWTFNLLTGGATVTDQNTNGSATNDALHFQLDPDVGVDVPTGVVLIDAANNTVLTNSNGLMRWTPTSDQVGTHTIMIILMDAGNPVLADSERLTVTVTAQTNTPPVVDLNGSVAGTGFTATFVAGSGTVGIVGTVDPNALTVTDAQNSDILSASVVLANASDGAAETLSVNTTGSGLTSTYDSANGTLQISGAASTTVYQTVLRTLMYGNSSTTPTVGQRTIQVTVNDGLTSTPVTSTVNVQSVGTNQPPNIATIPSNTLVIGETLQVTVTATDPNSADTLTFQIDADNSATNATIQRIDNNSATISWTPTAADGPGPHAVRVIVTDSGTPTLSDVEQFSVTVRFPTEIDLNGATAGTGFAATFVSGGPIAIVDSANLTVTDLDSTSISSVTATIQNALNGADEVLAVDTMTTGITSNYDTATRVLTLTGNNSSADDFQQVLRTLTYVNSSASPTAGDRSVEIQPVDGDLTTAIATSVVSINATATAPNLDLNGTAAGIDGTASFTEGSGPTAITTDALTITDVDSVSIVSATVIITNLRDGDAESLSVSINGTDVGVQYVNGVMTLAGTATLDTYEAILASLTYDNTSDNPDATPRLVEIQISDGVNLSPTANVTISIVPVDDSPVFAAIGDAQGEVDTPLTVNVSATDPEGGVVSFSLDTPPAGVMITDNGDGTATVTWTPTAVGDFTIRVVATDDSDPPMSSNEEFLVMVTAMNAAPVVDLNGDGEGINTTAAYVENDGLINPLPNVLTLTDDTERLASATITLTNPMDGADEVLSAITTGTGLEHSYADGVLTISGVATLNVYKSVLESVTYANLSESPDETDRVLNVVVNDGFKNSATATATISVTSVNDPPQFAAVAPQFVVVNTPLTVVLTVTDLDGDVLAVMINETMSPAGAVLSTLSGNEATFAWTPDTLGDFTFTIDATEVRSDAITPLTTTLELTITVHSPNTSPVLDLNGDTVEGIDGSAAFTEDAGPIALTTTNLSIVDAESADLSSATVTITNLMDGAAEVLSVTDGTGVTSIYADGVLTLTGTASLATYESILESLMYDNVSQNPSTENRLITVTVHDGLTSSVAATITVSVAAVNDSPILTEVPDQQAIIGEELVVMLVVDDPDSSELTYTLAGDSLPGAVIETIDDVTSFRWTPGADTVPGNFTVSVMVEDNADPAATDTVEFTVTVLARPALDLNGANVGTGFTGSWIFGGADVPILSPVRVTLTDADSPMLASATVTLTNPSDGTNEFLVASELGDVVTAITTDYDADQGILTLTGLDSIENYRLVIATIKYGNTAVSPTFGPRTIHLTVNDGILDSDMVVSTILVQPEADGSDTIATAKPLSVALGEAVVRSGLIDTGADVDIFSVSASAGETLFLAAVEGTAVDAYLRLFDAAGIELAASTEQTSFDVTADGTYFIGVSASDLTDYNPNTSGRAGNLTGGYVLSVSRYVTGTDNDTIPLAAALTVTTDAPTFVMDESLDSESDIDLFAVDVMAGQVLRVEVIDSDEDVIIRIFDKMGNTLGMTDGTSDIVTAGLSTDGTMYVGISSVDLGDYHPNNPAGRSGGSTIGAYDLEFSFSNAGASPADIDLAMADDDLFGHATFSP